MTIRNAIYTQSGGMTAVINASACGLIEAARSDPKRIGKLFAGRNGILGVLREELFDTSKESDEDIAALRETPGGAFGSCRYKLPEPDPDLPVYRRLLAVFKAHDIGFFFCNGGGDSQDTAWKVSQVCARTGYQMQCLGIPKTVDNDLPCTDCCPGFGSVAKYVATSIREADLDVASMCSSSTKVFIMEVMGRHAGWIAAAAGLAAATPLDAPHIILFPEIAFNADHFLSRVQQLVSELGYCVIVASEGVRYDDGRFLADADGKDAFGHVQLGGVAPLLATVIRSRLGYKCHWAVADYLQRAARHIASATDVAQAYALGRAAVHMAVAGKDAVMLVIVRESGLAYGWHLDTVPLHEVANRERPLPSEYIASDGFAISTAARSYLQPLIHGEDHPRYRDGLPLYVRLRNELTPPLLQGYAG